MRKLLILLIFASCELLPSPYEIYESELENIDEVSQDFSYINGVIWQRQYFLKVMEWGQLVITPLNDQDLYIDKVTKGGWMYNYGSDTVFATYDSGVYPESNVIQFNGVPVYKVITGSDSTFIAASVNPFTGIPLGSMFIFKEK